MVIGKILRNYTASSKRYGPYEMNVYAPPQARVELITAPVEAARTIALATQGYTGVYLPVVLTDPERTNQREQVAHLLQEVKKTKLSTPLEMVNFVFLIRGVSRAWTHQAVRYRIGTAYVQESMRFYGHRSVFQVLSTQRLDKPELDAYGEACFQAVKTYVELLEVGVEDQDARGVLPTNIMTNLFWSLSLKTLINVYRTRWCCQAQHSEWIPVLRQMRELIAARVDNLIAELFIRAPIHDGEPCGFNASFDRPCTWTPGEPHPVELAKLLGVEKRK